MLDKKEALNKEVKKRQPRSKNFTLLIYNFTKDNSKLPDNTILNFDKNWKQRRNYYVSALKKAKFIEKLGYGTWKIIRNYDENLIKQVKTSKKITTQDTLQQPRIRGHSFQFILAIPKIRNWENRREFLTKNNINYDPLNIIGKGERIFLKGNKIWLTSKSIIIHEKSSYLSVSAKGSKSYAIYNMLETIKYMENLFKIILKVNRRYKFKVSKQHYARLNCLLAKQYRKDGNKLYVKQEDGTTWFWTDYSLSIDESETGNTDRSDIDMDEHMHPFLNSLRRIKGYTPEMVINSLGQLAETSQRSFKLAEYYGEHHKSHVEAIQILGSSVKELKREVKSLRNTISQKKLFEWF